MNGSLLVGLIFTGWLAQATPPVSTPAHAQDKTTATAGVKLRIATSTYLSDGRVLTASASDWKLQANQPTVVYASSGRSLCDSRAAVTETPADAGYGWRLQITPQRETASELEVRVDWREMWSGGRPTVGSKQGTVVLTLHPGDRVIVDYLNAAANTLRLVNFFVRSDIADPNAKTMKLRHFTPIPEKNGCTAVGMGLEIGLEPAKSLPIVEAELWLVRPNRDGTERSERQVVRLPIGQPATSYFFDEQSLLTPLPAGFVLPTATVFGELSAFSVEGGKLHLNFTLSRRRKVGPSFSERPGNEARTDASYRDLQASPGEVVAFQLPTIEVPNLPQLSVRLRAQIVR